MMADFLANISLKENDITLTGISEIKVKIRPCVPDNVYNWQVFQDDVDLLRFLQCVDQYQSQVITFNDYVENINGKETLFGQVVVQLRTNKFPRGLVALERTFDTKDGIETIVTPASKEYMEKVNLGRENTPKNLYIGKKLSLKMRERLIIWLRNYRHVFVWSYKDLKACREDLSQHEIPLKSIAKPFR